MNLFADLQTLSDEAATLIAAELSSMLESHRSYIEHPGAGRRQTDAEVLADDDHEEIDNGAYEEMNAYCSWLDRHAALTVAISSEIEANKGDVMSTGSEYVYQLETERQLKARAEMWRDRCMIAGTLNVVLSVILLCIIISNLWK